MKPIIKYLLLSYLLFPLSLYAEDEMKCPEGPALSTIQFTETNLMDNGEYSVTGHIAELKTWMFMAIGKASSPEEALQKAKETVNSLALDKSLGNQCRYTNATDFRVGSLYLE